MDRRKTRIRTDLVDGFGIRVNGWFVPISESDVETQGMPVLREWCWVHSGKATHAGVYEIRFVRA